MKKQIGLIGSEICFWIGHAFCKVSYIKKKGEFLFDKYGFQWAGTWLCKQYQMFMHWSLEIQEWAGNERPWKKPTQKELDTILG